MATSMKVLYTCPLPQLRPQSVPALGRQFCWLACKDLQTSIKIYDCAMVVVNVAPLVGEVAVLTHLRFLCIADIRRQQRWPEEGRCACSTREGKQLSNL